VTPLPARQSAAGPRAVVHSAGSTRPRICPQSLRSRFGGRTMVAGGLVRPGGRNGRIRGRVVWTMVAELTERPFDAVTMTRLATRSGIARSTLNRRWGSPDAVLADAVDDLLQRRIGRGIGTTSRAAPERQPRSTDLLVIQLRGLMRWLSDRETSGVLLAALARVRHDEVLDERVARIWAHELEDLRRVLARTVPAAGVADINATAERTLGVVIVRTLMTHQGTTGPDIVKLGSDVVQELLCVCRRHL